MSMNRVVADGMTNGIMITWWTTMLIFIILFDFWRVTNNDIIVIIDVDGDDDDGDSDTAGHEM